MRRGSIVIPFVAIACAPAAAPPKPPSTLGSASTSATSATSATPPAPTTRPIEERVKLVAQGWRRWSAGEKDAAKAAFEEAIATAGAALVAGVGDGVRLDASPGGTYASIETESGIVLVDVASKMPRAFAAGNTPSWPNERAVLVADGASGGSIVDPSSGAVLASYPSLTRLRSSYVGKQSLGVGDGHRVFVAVTEDGAPPTVRVFDLDAHAEVGILRLGAATTKGLAAPMSRSLQDAEYVENLYVSPDGREVVAWLDRGTALWEAGPPYAMTGSFQAGPLQFGFGAFDPTGKWVAILTSHPFPDGAAFDGAVALVARGNHEVVASLDACGYPSSVAWSSDGKTMAVGDLRRTCLFDVASRKLLRKTDVVRQSFPSDDLQATHRAAFFGKDLLVTETDDGTVAVMRVGTGKVVASPGGGGLPWVVAPDAFYFYAGDSLTKVDASAKVTTRALRKEESALPESIPELAFELAPRLAALRAADAASATLCSTSGLAFPTEICAAHGVK